MKPLRRLLPSPVPTLFVDTLKKQLPGVVSPDAMMQSPQMYASADVEN